MAFREGCFEITTKCGWRCLHCSSDYPFEADLPAELLQSAFGDFAAQGGRRAELSGGDPTEHPRFWEILRGCAEAVERVVVFTNSTGEDPERLVDGLLEVGAELSLTVLGIGKTHDLLSGVESYGTVAGLYRLARERGLRVTPHLVLTLQNLGDLSTIMDTFPGAKGLRLMPQGRAWDNWDRLAPRPPDLREALAGVKMRTGSHLTIPLRCEGKCTAGTGQFLVTPLGSVVPCASFKRYGVKLGNLWEDRLEAILSDGNPRLSLWRRIKGRFSGPPGGGLVNRWCWGDYLHGGLEHPLRRAEMSRRFGSPDLDFSRWREAHPARIYIVGAHGVGKSTLLEDLVGTGRICRDPSRNPYREDVYRRQLWRLYKYKRAEMRLSALPSGPVAVNRCPLDWLVYTNAFLELGWLTGSEHRRLLDRYRDLFGGPFVPSLAVWLDPPVDWSERRIEERWEETGEVKWREGDFEYYTAVREEYHRVLGSASELSKIYRVEATDRKERLELGALAMEEGARRSGGQA
jgi:MoaA/NifB/PqqE/SkfB family radical SAM enzyme